MNPSGTFLGLGFLLSEVGLALWRRSSAQPTSRRMDAGSLRTLWIINLSAIAVGVWLAAAGFGPRIFTGPTCGWISLAGFIAGTVLRWWAIFYLGRFFTVDVAVAADHRVVQTGPYRLVRHPSYSGLLLQFGGLALSLDRWLSLVVIMLPITIALLNRIRVEEAALSQTLGASYTTYMNKTRRLIPWVF